MTNEELRNLIKARTLSRKPTDLYKYVLAESERFNKSIENVVTKLIEGNETNYKLTSDPKYLDENKELNALLPLYVPTEELMAIISPLNLDNSGKSIGLAVKELKSKGISFRMEDVRNILSGC